MINEYKLALQKKEILVIITLGIVLAILSVFSTRNISNNNIEHLPSAYQASLVYGMNMLRILYIVLIPIIAALSYADSFLQEKRSGIYSYRLIRETKAHYFFTKATVVFSLAFVLTVLPLALNQVFCLLMLSSEQHKRANEYAL